MIDAEPLDHIFPGSWINANFDVWIGAEEDNQAWDLSAARARRPTTRPPACPRRADALAFEELLIAEGSDWCWWYGPEHDSANRLEFDQLYRNHLANVYRFLNLAPPEELSRPILKIAGAGGRMRSPTGPYPARRSTARSPSYFEWMGAGRVPRGRALRLDARQEVPGEEVHFGSDGENLFLRLDFRPGTETELAGMEARVIAVQSLENAPPARYLRLFARRGPDEDPVECAFRRILEARFPLAAAERGSRRRAALPVIAVARGPPMDACPQQGWLEMHTTVRRRWRVRTFCSALCGERRSPVFSTLCRSRAAVLH